MSSLASRPAATRDDHALRAALNQPYDGLQTLPRELWRWALVCSSGEDARRLRELQAWRLALAEGRLPERALDFGDAEATLALRTLVGEMEMPELTQGSDPMSMQVLRSALWHLDTLIDRPAHVPRTQAIDTMLQAFREEWTTQRQGWEEVLALLQSLGDVANLRWDQMQGHLNRREWAEARRIGQLLEHLPKLSQFIDGVGRREERVKLPPAQQPQPTPHRPRQPRAEARRQQERLPEPGGVDGIRRSRDIARMTGAERQQFGHPTLHRLWRARFAEGQLMAYDDRIPDRHSLPLPDPPRNPNETQPRPAGRGPLIVCMDTSGSMRGAPENVAKACVLQALRTAHKGRRGCKLIAFGGPDELLERDLELTVAGLDNLLDTMGQSFDGGTDVQTPIERAVQLVQSAEWADADILIVSDGEFGVTPATLRLLRDAKQRLGLRAHGILIGDRETIALIEVCDQLHWVRDWRRYGAGKDARADGFSPVHSRSLTALYFPNAIQRS